jgi:hypothetical protein
MGVLLSTKKLWLNYVTIAMSCSAVTMTPMTTVPATKAPRTIIHFQEDCVDRAMSPNLFSGAQVVTDLCTAPVTITTRASMPHTSPLPVFNHQRGEFVIDPDSSTRVYQPFRGLQSVQPLPTVTLNPRVGMVVEGGKLYLAQTLHHYYRKHIHCPRHGPINGRLGHHRTARKVHESGQVYRVWYCTPQPKDEGHRIDNTAYIELAKEQLDQALFDRVLCELIRQLRSRDCQLVERNQPPQPDDFDYLALLSYIDR